MDKSDELVVGIDLGTTNSCIAVKRNGKVEVIPNSEGERTTLSFVYYSNQNDVLIGETGKHEAASNPCNGIYETKRLMGYLYDDPEIEQHKKSLIYNIACGTNGDVKIEINQENEKKYKFPEEVCGWILHKLKIDAENYLGEKLCKAVITVPAYFNNNQRAATRDAAKIAGFQVLKLINEPSAAAIAYIQENEMKKTTKRVRTILIYDLGGGTFDVSILKVTDNKSIRVLSVDGDTLLGGQDFLNRLVYYMTEQIENKSKTEIKQNKRYMASLINSCERAKRILTTAQRTKIAPEFLLNHLEILEFELTRAKFEEINEDLFRRTVTIVDKCLKNGQLSKGDVDEVLLVGGSSRIPRIASLLKEYFGDKVIQRNINADESIAIGAAIEADLISKNENNSFLIDVLPLPIGVVLDDQTIVFHFNRNHPLPDKSKRDYQIKNDKNEAKKWAILSIFEGDHMDCNKNVLLGAHEIKYSKSVSVRKVEISMEIYINGIIKVLAKGESIKTFNIVLNKGRLDDEEIIKIRKEITNKMEIS